jgi:hypothetical protein
MTTIAVCKQCVLTTYLAALVAACAADVDQADSQSPGKKAQSLQDAQHSTLSDEGANGTRSEPRSADPSSPTEIRGLPGCWVCGPAGEGYIVCRRIPCPSPRETNQAPAGLPGTSPAVDGVVMQSGIFIEGDQGTLLPFDAASDETDKPKPGDKCYFCRLRGDVLVCMPVRCPT